MAKVLSISSQVIYGHVGNSATAFVMQRMGHDVLPLPTILLSNRPGYKALAGEPVAVDKLDALLRAAEENGWLSEIDGVLTGYIPTPEHAELSRHWIAKIRAANPAALYLCDPVVGDLPRGLYVSEATAEAVRDVLVPEADAVTPNLFELGWLARRPIASPASAIAAALALARPTVVVTSAPSGKPDSVANILVKGGEVFATVSPRRALTAHGTGDALAAFLLSYKLNGFVASASLRAATAAIDAVIEKSEGRSELALIETQAVWAAADPVLAPLASLPGLDDDDDDADAV
ncbi:pyridoxal kinase [Rhodomicrobium vannielii ATCC 17100]|uniref:pyridoxal kinase n=1 Tax=Rhodomicrobium vannielii TaxID=1069 RepID=UPI00191B65C9|nr:pyridoxal kinase [Rhodomicrobium vannielii]MBJ7536047.1 pyridoxal kinase [Rhodomicrobium vannielii ATCC 17100]